MELKGKAALITGGNSGIGKAIAYALAERGTEVLISGRREDQNRAVAEAISKKTGTRVEAVTADVSLEEDCEMMVRRTIELFGKIDICVNSAGVSTGPQFSDLSTEVFDQVLKTNLYGAFWCSRAAYNAMRKNKLSSPDDIRGYIINISSVVGLEAYARSGAGSGVYSASKFGMMSLNQGMSGSGQKELIKVTAICPAMVATPMTDEWRNNNSKEGDEFIEPEDVAETVLYLTRLSRAVWPVQEVLPRREVE